MMAYLVHVSFDILLFGYSGFRVRLSRFQVPMSVFQLEV